MIQSPLKQSEKYINLGYGSTADDHMLSDSNPRAKTIVLTEDNFHLYESDGQGFYTKKTQPEKKRQLK